MTIPILPDDVLYLLCEELALQEQFDTLFNCACANRIFAVPALTNLYRAHHLAPVRGGGDDETASMATKRLIFQKWSILWRSIIASSLESTLFPYCRYIKTLDLRDLRYLLEDHRFRGEVSKAFFSEPMAHFHITMGRTRSSDKGLYHGLNCGSIVDAIGDVVTQHAPMLEGISGALSSDWLIRCAPRLPRLQSLELYDGSPLESDALHASVKEHCPHFNSLSIYSWAGNPQQVDTYFANFLRNSRPQSMRMLETIRNIGAGVETFSALNLHGNSLKDLRLCVGRRSLPELSLLQGCTALEALRIEDENTSNIDLEQTHNGTFMEMRAWLSKCEKLRVLSFSGFRSAPAIITPLLLGGHIRLRKLEIDSYLPRECAVFHRALTHQKESLRVLQLVGDTDNMCRDDVDTIVDSLTQLTGLTTLKLALVLEIFQDDHLIAIISDLKNLEDLYITGMEVKDGVLDCVGRLTYLKSVTFSGISKFTLEGIIEFVSRLTPGNQGIRIMIDMADPDTLLSEDEIALVREVLAEKMGGIIEYVPWRDPDISEFEGDSD